MTRKYNIIIVENDADEQLFIKEGFDASSRFNIIAQVRNGDTLLEWFDNNSKELPDLILSDLNMPGRNGYDIISEIRKRADANHIPVVITSTSSIRSVIDKCMDMGAAAYLIKPDSFMDYPDYAEQLFQLIEERKLVG